MREIQMVAAALLATAVSGANAWSTDYYLVSANHNQIAVIDRDAIVHETAYLSVAPLIAIRNASDTGGYNFAYVVINSKFDCRQHQVAAIFMTLFGRDGQLTPRQPPHGTELHWTTAMPNTQAGNALKFVCDKAETFPSQDFRFQGLTLPQIVGSMFDGTWPYDEVLSKPPYSQAAP